MSSRYATRVFAAAGAVNLLVGLTGLVAPDVLCGLLGTPVPVSRVFLQLAMWLIAVVGIGYCLTAYQPVRNRDLMRIGALGKLLVLPLMFAAWRRSEVGGMAVVASGGDLAFGLLFVDVLRRMGRG